MSVDTRRRYCFIVWNQVYLLQSDNGVANLYVGDAFADGLDDTSTLVPEDDGESALRVLSRQCVGICL